MACFVIEILKAKLSILGKKFSIRDADDFQILGYFFSASIFSLESIRLGNGMATVVATIFFRKFLRLSIIYLVIISMGLCIRNVKNHLLSHCW